MKLLAIESTGAMASVAMIDEQGNVTVQRSEQTMNHLQHLIPMIQQLLTNCESTMGDITGILVSEGPGSFTGIRIGMATAKALAQVKQLPVAAVPTLRSFAYHKIEENIVVCPVFDARRDQIYAGAYVWQRAAVDAAGAEANANANAFQPRQLVADGAYGLQAFLSAVKTAIFDLEMELKAVRFFGDGLVRYGEDILRWGEELRAQTGVTVEFAEEAQRFQDARSVALLGRELFLRGKQRRFDEIQPVYLRQAEAQRKLEEKQNGLAAQAESGGK